MALAGQGSEGRCDQVINVRYMVSDSAANRMDLGISVDPSKDTERDIFPVLSEEAQA